MYEWALTGKKKALSPDHITALEMVYHLGILCEDQGKLKLVEGMYQTVLNRYREALGPHHEKLEPAADRLQQLTHK